MDAIPLIRARYLQAFAAAVERTGVRPQRLLEAVKIPVGILENPDALHPAQQLFDFAGQAARVTGQTDLGLVAGRTKLEDHGAFGNRVSGAPTLHQALETFCSEALKEYSRAPWLAARRAVATVIERTGAQGLRTADAAQRAVRLPNPCHTHSEERDEQDVATKWSAGVACGRRIL